MAARMDGTVALVTGGSSGIGFATCLAFAREGTKVVLGDISAEGGDKAERMIKEAGGEGTFVKTDVSRAAEVEALVKSTVEAYGRLDYAFNNAGIEGTMASTVDCTEENWDRTIDINLKGVWLCMKYEIPQMLRRGKGAIVNMASVAGLVGSPNSPAYCASKGGVIQLTRTAALEYAKAGIRINAVCPGAIRTPMIERVIAAQPDMREALATMHPIGRMGEPEEIAEAVIWLCSPAASFVTGQALAIDGGFVAQ